MREGEGRGGGRKEEEVAGREGDDVNTVYVSAHCILRTLRSAKIKFVYKINDRVHTSWTKSDNGAP